MYRYEMHLHSDGCSACAVSTATEMVEAAKAHGYAGVVFTNHFYRGNTCVDRSLSWHEFTDAYRRDCDSVRKMARALELDVLFGVEESYRPGREVLIYGIEPDVIANEEGFPHYTREELADFTRRNGGFIVVAHPFRVRDYIPDPDVVEPPACFDAVEVYNAANSPEDNLKAWRYARENNLPAISGGDVHNAERFGRGGLAFEERIRTQEELVNHLKSGSYSLILDGRILSWTKLRDTPGYLKL